MRSLQHWLKRRVPTHAWQPGSLRIMETCQDLLLDLGQVVLQQGLLLHAVLAVGQHQWQQVPLVLVADHVQIRQVRWVHRLTGGNRAENELEKLGNFNS
ncbi:unnamed protein product [Leuciscus chuanchicus]